ncbi:MAG TPA: (Fe-S)-binding protein [Dehalococcoidia bacterium]|nr:(Fe-S)-binding protein [Dehalococcoidia bacterium]
MPDLKFDKTICAKCKATSCLVKCQYMNFKNKDKAKKEWQKVINGEDSSVLEACTTCYACEEYCPFGNHPFYLIVERQEEKGILPAPRPIVTMWINLCQPVGRFKVGKVEARALSYCYVGHFNTLVNGKLFDGIAWSVVFGQEFFCNAVYLHYAKASLIKDRLPKIIENIKNQGIKELICLHDECYGTFTSLTSAYGIDTPFKPIHYYEYLYGRLNELKDLIKPLNIKAAYQRNCSARLCPETDHYVDDIFGLLGVERVKRKYDGENALCCAEVFRMAKGPALADDVQKRNIDDMAKFGAEYCVFNCPACWDSLANKVVKQGIKPIHMIDLCKLAIGEEQALRLPELVAEV